MKKKLLLSFGALLFLYPTFCQTNTIQLEDTNLISSQRWRDTCFGLIDKSVSQIGKPTLTDPIRSGFFQKKITVVANAINSPILLVFRGEIIE